MVHLGKTVFGLFEILTNYGTSWKINILESSPPLNIPSPTKLPPTKVHVEDGSGGGTFGLELPSICAEAIPT